MNRVALIVAAALTAALAVAWRVDRGQYGDQRYDEGKAEIEAKWNASVLEAVKQAAADEERQRKRNEETAKQYAAEVAAADGRASDLERRLRSAVARSCPQHLSQGRSDAGAAVASAESGSEGSAGVFAEIASAIKRYDAACIVVTEGRDALIKELIPQL